MDFEKQIVDAEQAKADAEHDPLKEDLEAADKAPKEALANYRKQIADHAKSQAESVALALGVVGAAHAEKILEGSIANFVQENPQLELRGEDIDSLAEEMRPALVKALREQMDHMRLQAEQFQIQNNKLDLDQEGRIKAIKDLIKSLDQSDASADRKAA